MNCETIFRQEQIHAVFRYNLEQNDDDPLSEAVVEEIRHADAMDIIR